MKLWQEMYAYRVRTRVSDLATQKVDFTKCPEDSIEKIIVQSIHKEVSNWKITTLINGKYDQKHCFSDPEKALAKAEKLYPKSAKRIKANIIASYKSALKKNASEINELKEKNKIIKQLIKEIHG